MDFVFVIMNLCVYLMLVSRWNVHNFMLSGDYLLLSPQWIELYAIFLMDLSFYDNFSHMLVS